MTITRHRFGARYPAAMRTALAALALVVAAGGAQAVEQPTAKQLIKAFGIANSDCRGSADPSSAETQMECDRRSRIVGRLSQMGWCYGRKAQVGADYSWHRCTPASNKINDLVEGPQ